MSNKNLDHTAKRRKTILVDTLYLLFFKRYTQGKFFFKRGWWRTNSDRQLIKMYV